MMGLGTSYEVKIAERSSNTDEEPVRMESRVSLSVALYDSLFD